MIEKHHTENQNASCDESLSELTTFCLLQSFQTGKSLKAFNMKSVFQHRKLPLSQLGGVSNLLHPAAVSESTSTPTLTREFSSFQMKWDQETRRARKPACSAASSLLSTKGEGATGAHPIILLYGTRILGTDTPDKPTAPRSGRLRFYALSPNYSDPAGTSGSQLLCSRRCRLSLRNGICIQASTGGQKGEGRKRGSPHLLESDIPRISFSLLTIPNPFSRFLGAY